MGHMLYVLGNVRISQKRLDEAYSLHKRTINCWLKTYGEEHHKTGDAWHKLGWHEARLRNFEEARYGQLDYTAHYPGTNLSQEMSKQCP
jgi:TolA-binding protein